jgi:hypothetical protein
MSYLLFKQARVRKAYRCHQECSCTAPCSSRLRKIAGVQSITTTTPSFCWYTLALLKESQARGCASCSGTATVSKLPAITTRGHFISVALSPSSTDQNNGASSKAVKYIRQTPVHNKVTANLDWFGWIYPEHKLYLLERRPQVGRSVLILRPSPMPAGFASNRYLEFNPQCHLTCTVASIFCCLGGSKHTKRRLAAYVRCRRRVVGTVQHVGKRRFEP